MEVAPGGGDQAVRGKRDGDELKMRRGSSGTGMVDWQGQRGQMGSTEEEAPRGGTGMVDWQGQRGQAGSTEEERLTAGTKQCEAQEKDKN